SAGSTETTKTATTTAPYVPAAVVATVAVTDVVPSGRRAVLTLVGAKPASAVLVRTARGTVAAHGRVHAGGRLELKLPTSRLGAGKHGFTVMYVDARGLHHTKNLKVRVAGRHH
ncbi:MAG TPA: phospholipase, partial [Marmoricola sp.]|nr:phospholipase [Marmoricola sp.]